MKSLLLLLLTLSPGYSLGQAALAPADCVNQEQVNSFFANYQLYNWSEEGNQQVEVTSIANLCDSKDLSVRLVKTIEYMKTLNEFQNPQSSSIVFREGASNYFSKRIKHIVVEPKDETVCPAGVIAYVYGIEEDVMHICSATIERFTSNHMMTYIFVHEARHTEGYNHVDCDHGPYKRAENGPSIMAACDDSYEKQGSYGIGAGFLLEVAKYSKDPLEKQDARSRAVVDLIQRFNKMPLGLKAGLVAQSQSGEISFFDGMKRQPLTQLENPASKMIFRMGLPMFFDPRGTVQAYAYHANLIDGEGEYAKNYVTLYQPSERESFRDVYYGEDLDYSCLLFAHNIECRDMAADEKTEFAFPHINARQFFAEDKTLHIISEEGMIYELHNTWNMLKDWSKSPAAVLLPVRETSSNVKSVTSFNEGKTEFAVSLKGELAKLDPKTKSWVPVQEYQGNTIEKVVGPFWWSKKLEAL